VKQALGIELLSLRAPVQPEISLDLIVLQRRHRFLQVAGSVLAFSMTPESATGVAYCAADANQTCTPDPE